MKKQNVNKLAFNKAAVAELNENQLVMVKGGTYVNTLPSDLSCTFCISSSNGNWTRDEFFQNQML
ncbi:MAG TPA: class I lanthipeptide [Flavobacterium sp.]|jgi:hypothetical protein|nr:class I lanthipeptide [Flavobacterium sp.]